MVTGNGGSMGDLVTAVEYQRHGVQNIKNQSIAIIQKDSLNEHTVRGRKKVSEATITEKRDGKSAKTKDTLLEIGSKVEDGSKPRR